MHAALSLSLTMIKAAAADYARSAVAVTESETAAAHARSAIADAKA